MNFADIVLTLLYGTIHLVVLSYLGVSVCDGLSHCFTLDWRRTRILLDPTSYVSYSLLCFEYPLSRLFSMLHLLIYISVRDHVILSMHAFDGFCQVRYYVTV